jgi:hypothetical protein
MLVVANAYLVPRTRPLIPRDLFFRLLHRTIKLLYLMSPCSSVFFANMCVLHNVEGKVAVMYNSLCKDDGMPFLRFHPNASDERMYRRNAAAMAAQNQAQQQQQQQQHLMPAPSTPSGFPEGMSPGMMRAGTESATTSFSGKNEM